MRLTECGGPEAAWVVAVPGRPEHRLSNTTWRDSFCMRLAVPLPFLANGPLGYDCHDAFDWVSREIATSVRVAARRRRTRPPQVDCRGEHDQRCPRASTLSRHDCVQDVVRAELRYGGKRVKTATVHELRDRSNVDMSKAKGDLRVDNMLADGLPMVIDFGITHSLRDTYVNLPSRRRSVALVPTSTIGSSSGATTAKDLHGHLHYRSFTLGTLGSFGASVWGLIDIVCDRNHPHAHDDCCGWRDPDPRRRFILSVGFALQRANSRMLRAAHRRRLSARYAGRSSGFDSARAH